MIYENGKIGLNERTFLLETVKRVAPDVNTEELWEKSADMDERYYKWLLALCYNNKIETLKKELNIHDQQTTTT